MKKIIFIVLCLHCTGFLFAQKTDKKLQANLKNDKRIQWRYWYICKESTTGKTVSINADTIFPTASIVKVPILIGVMDKIQKGELNYDSTLFTKIHYYMKGRYSWFI